jgi:hypothetical protein
MHFLIPKQLCSIISHSVGVRHSPDTIRPWLFDCPVHIFLWHWIPTHIYLVRAHAQTDLFESLLCECAFDSLRIIAFRRRTSVFVQITALIGAEFLQVQSSLLDCTLSRVISGALKLDPRADARLYWTRSGCRLRSARIQTRGYSPRSSRAQCKFG